MIGPLAVSLLLVGPGPAPGAGVRWERDFDAALKKARATGKPLVVDFWADWCLWCHRLDRSTYVDPVVVKLSEGFVPVKVDTEGGSKEAAVALRYDVLTLPTIAFLSPSGRMLMRVDGYQGPGQFPKTMEAAKEVAARVIAWEHAIERDPADAAALAGLGVHLFEQEAYSESAELLERAVQADVKRPIEERKRTRLLLGAILKSEEQFVRSEAVLKTGLALPPAGEYDAKILYVLGRLYLAWGRTPEARTALTQVVKEHGQTAIARKARETLVAFDKR